MRQAPFPPLLAGGEELRHAPSAPDALRKRMGQVYCVPEACVIPVRGASHGLDLVLRLAAREGYGSVVGEPALARLAAINGLALLAETRADTGAIVIASPSSLQPDAPLAPDEMAKRLDALPAGFLVLDESFIEFSDAPSLAAMAASSEKLIVLRSLCHAYGLAGAPCGALIAGPKLVAALSEMLAPDALATPIVRLASDVLAASRAPRTHERIAELKRERKRVTEALSCAPALRIVKEGAGPFVFFNYDDRGAAGEAIARFGVRGAWVSEGSFRLDIGLREENDCALSAFGVSPPASSRRVAEIVRDTRETRIVAAVDLDQPGPVRIATGIGFFDHMLEQIAHHGGFSLQLSCEGDLVVDAHHTIEDCALALGQALTMALGNRRGIARFGFVLPMDEAEARVSVDLSGRPFLRFDGGFSAPLIGIYPTEMTEHVFRSLAQSMGATIHLAVTGANDHHMTEACYKAFGRALRQAIRHEGGDTPSTKGTLT